MRRVYLIARRDFIGYVKTWGFWISFFLPFLFGILGIFAATLDLNVQPTRYETLLDDTGKHAHNMVALDRQIRTKDERLILETLSKNLLSEDDKVRLMQEYDAAGMEGARDFIDRQFPGAGKRIKVPAQKTVYVDLPAQTIDGLQPFLRGEEKVLHAGTAVRLSGVLHIYEADGLKADYWSENINSRVVSELAQNYFRDLATLNYLKSGGLNPEGLAKARSGSIAINNFDPTKIDTGETGSQAVTLEDRVPFFVAAILAGILWLTVFSGSYMLLTSMLEEKLNKLLEMMLASTRFSEIMVGKLIGVAALTLTAMLPYLLLGAGVAVTAVFYGPTDMSAGLKAALNAKMIIFFIVFLILGYVFYGAFFIALGALAESMQDAQTLTTPIMLILTFSVLVVPLGLENPDSPIVIFASWFPLSAPFAALIRLPADPPLWELCVSAFFLFLCAMAVMWLAGRIFRFGVLSGGGVKGVKAWIVRKVFRRA